VVEDAASACAVSGAGVGIALLGTNLTNTHLHTLRRFETVVVALDPDATRKALELQKQISFFTRCVVRRIDDDLKYFDADEVRRMLL
jgi:DNA primase